MRIAVFGTTGQVSTEILRQRSPDLDLIGIGRDVADFARPETVEDAIAGVAVDAVINGVAYTAVDKAESDVETAHLVNAVSVGHLARACAARDLPLVHISTDYVFDGQGTAPHRPGDATAPLGVYGRTKRDGELAIAEAAGPHAILRTSWVFSAVGNNFVKTMLRLSETRDHLTVVEDQVGGPTAAHAISEAAITLARRLAAGAPGGTYHFAGAPDVSWAEFAREIFHLADRNVAVTGIPTTDYPTPAARPLNSRLDCESLARDHGIARPDWRVDLARVLKELT